MIRAIHGVNSLSSRHHPPIHALLGKLKPQLGGKDPSPVDRDATAVDECFGKLEEGVDSGSIQFLKNESYMGCDDS